MIFPYIRYMLDNAPVLPIPTLYWNNISPEQRIHRMCHEISKLASYAAYLGDELAKIEDPLNEQITSLREQIATVRSDLEAEISRIESDYETFEAGGFVDVYLTQIEAWINSHIEEFFAQAAKMVFFGLDGTGHLVAYIPESWDDITFDTGAEYGTETYGRLILEY